MTRKLITIVCTVMLLGMLTGCGPSALQIQAEIAYYEAIASITKNQASQPIFTMVATDATKPIILENVAKIEVYAQSSDSHRNITQYVQKDYNEPAWRFLTTLASVVTPWVGAYYMIDAVKDMGSVSNTYNNNVAQDAVGNFRVQGNTSVTSSGSGAATATGMTDATSTPTVVNPVIVEQPAPIIVTQPEPIVVK